MNEEQQQSVVESPPSPGQQLQQARKVAGMSVKDVADKLRLKPSHIEQLEADEVDESISLTFTKGYLKNYAKQVGMDEAALLADFDAHHKTSKEPAKLQSFSRRVTKQANDDRLMLVTYLVVVIVIALVVLWWWQQGSSGSVFASFETGGATVNAEPVQPVQEEMSAAAETPVFKENIPLAGQQSTPSVQPAVDAAMVEETTATLGATNSEEAPPQSAALINTPAEAVPSENVQDPRFTTDEFQAEDAGQENDLVETETAAVGAAEKAPRPQFDPTGLDKIELVFQFAGDCWINITDATGEAIAYGVKAEGRVMPISGYPPFEVVLGAPEVVQISYDGDVVDMSQFPSGRTARFELPLAE